ncbi:MAG: DNA primase [Marivirga sp.]|nr:DNA primase [Marivirga sp.]
MALSFSDAKRIPITDYLAGLGFEPAKIRGSDYWYLSPFRHERSPSLKVNSKLNVWYDHGSGEGGTLIDLGSKLHQCTLHEFLEKVSNTNYQFNSSFRQRVNEIPENRLEILSTTNLSDLNLIHYLNGRGIRTEVGTLHCKEVEFKIGAKIYSALGFQNRSGGYELRNRWFKGSSSPKDISLIDRQATSLCVLEGFMDFLSILSTDDNNLKAFTAPSNFLILNSLSFLNKNLDTIKAHDQVNLFLDNDLAGTEAKQNLTSKGMSFHDASTLYSPYKDVNEFLMKNKDLDISSTRSRGKKL